MRHLKVMNAQKFNLIARQLYDLIIYMSIQYYYNL